METALVVDLVDEPWKVPGDVVEGFVGHRIDGFDLERLDEALGLGVVVGIAAAPHRTDKTAAKQGSPIGLSGVLRTAVGMVNAAGLRFSALDCGVERRERQADVDRAADRIADRPARPGVENDRNVSKAIDDGDVGNVGDPELVWPVDPQILGAVGINRLVMVAVGRGDIAPPPARLKVVLTHQPADLLVIDDHSSMAQLGANASPAVGFKLLADRRDRLNDGGVVLRGSRFAVEGRPGDPHQPASFCDAEARGPATTDVVTLFGRGALFRAPFRNSSSNACLPTRRSSAAIRASYCGTSPAAAASSSNSPASYF